MLRYNVNDFAHTFHTIDQSFLCSRSIHLNHQTSNLLFFRPTNNNQAPRTTSNILTSTKLQTPAKHDQQHSAFDQAPKHWPNTTSIIQLSTTTHAAHEWDNNPRSVQLQPSKTRNIKPLTTTTAAYNWIKSRRHRFTTPYSKNRSFSGLPHIPKELNC